MKITTTSEQQTQDLAQKILADFNTGGIIALNGDLGSGKTAFTKGVAKFLGIRKPITSPTFVLMKNYKTKHNKIKYLVHVDTYRLANSQELVDIGLTDFFNRDDTLVIIEWADKIRDILPSDVFEINFEHGKNENERIVKY